MQPALHSTSNLEAFYQNQLNTNSHKNAVYLVRRPEEEEEEEEEEEANDDAEMPFLETAQEWLTQSRLLLLARPSSTRITTKYTLPRHGTARRGTRRCGGPEGAGAAAPTATLTLKTFDPVSGVTLKYATHKAAEVGRLVQIMGRLARGMAGLEMSEELGSGGGGGGGGDAIAPGATETEGKAAAKTVGGGKKSKKGRK
ncbi:hypothetical protein K3495_g553 [Podosphaera aphanis]|nr:hypothetical protein K3495_g553 [Podosphaera aphanis]